MANNPFADALKPEEYPFMHDQSAMTPNFFQQAKLVRVPPPGNLSRQELFEQGYITVKDLDDEELREGRCRGRDGRIPRRAKKTDLLPRDMYDEMVAEHLKRSQEKLRSQMDVALGTMVEIMTDETCEPKDRMDAAKYIFERVAGRTPDRVQVAVAKAPWEEMVQGISQMSRRESREARGVIDAEVVEPVEDSTSAPPVQEQPTPWFGNPAAEHNTVDDRPTAAPTPGIQGQGDSTSMGSQADRKEDNDLMRPNPIQQLGIDNLEAFGDLRITKPIPTPTHDMPENTSATAPLTNNQGKPQSELLREQAEAANALAERRKARKEGIQAAKKKRIVARAMGQDANQTAEIKTTENDGRLQFKLT